MMNRLKDYEIGGVRQWLVVEVVGGSIVGVEAVEAVVPALSHVGV